MNCAFVICDLFPPAFGPRMGYLCKYLQGSKWTPIVITENINDNTFEFLCKDINVTYVNFYKYKGFKGKIEWIVKLLRTLLCNYKDKKMYREAMKIAAKHKFDMVLCSTFRTFPLVAAQRVAEELKLPLIVDLRDIIEQFTGDEFIAHDLPNLLGLEKLLAAYFCKKSLERRNAVLRRAKAVTTVSPWHVEVLKQFNPNVNLIYNGFDPDIFYPQKIGTEYFTVTYTGRLMSLAMRSPQLLFEALQRLASEKIISAQDFQVRWYVDEKSRQMLENVVSAYPCVSELMHYLGYVPATDIPRILNESSINLILTNKSGKTSSNGIMTTKFFEALAVGKPILCVRGDEGCLEDAILSTKCGLSAHNADEVYEFIKEKYLSWKRGEIVVADSDREAVQKFSRKKQAQQFIGIFDLLVNS